MIELDKLKDIIQMMVDNDLSEVALRDGEETIKLRRGAGHAPQPVPTVFAPAVIAPQAVPAAASAGVEPAATDGDAGLIAIKSPMVGTYYSAPDPSSPPFVAVGSSVHPDTVVCVLEAMKVFNEIKAEVAGTVVQVLVANEDPVEYGQPLFIVRPR